MLASAPRRDSILERASSAVYADISMTAAGPNALRLGDRDEVVVAMLLGYGGAEFVPWRIGAVV